MTFKPGDKVAIVGRSSNGEVIDAVEGTVMVASSFKDCWNVATTDGYRSIPAAHLRPLSKFKAGDRVLVKASGEEGAILRVWHSEGVADVYELEDEFCDADELEIAPKRVPKAGEVWQSSRSIYLATDAELNPFVTLPDGLTCLQPDDAKFAAASLKDAAALGLL